jgi:hypothetical protein
MAGKTEPSPGYFPHPPPIAQAREITNAGYQVCVRVEWTLPKCLRAQEISILDAYLDLANGREDTILAL